MNKRKKRGTNAKKSTRVTLGAWAEPGLLLLANLSSALGISIIHTEFVNRGTVWSARLTSPDDLERIAQRKDNKIQLPLKTYLRTLPLGQTLPSAVDGSNWSLHVQTAVWTTDDLWFDSRWGQKPQLYSKAHAPAEGVDPSCYSRNIGSLSSLGEGPRSKSPMRKTYQSPPSRAEVKNMWSHISTPPHTFLVCTGSLSFTVQNWALCPPRIWRDRYLQRFRALCVGGTALHDESTVTGLQVGLHRILRPD